MADFTTKAIREAFVKLLNQKPLRQISVRDIVDECGINRNTFYYHFQDIPQLLESIVKEDADRIMAEYPRISSIEECVDAAIGFSLANRNAVLHIYRSVNRDIFEQYQWRVCEYVVSRYTEELFEGKNISESDRKTVTAYVKCVCFGIVMGWLESGLQEDIQQFAHRICELKLGSLEEMIDRCHHL